MVDYFDGRLGHGGLLLGYLGPQLRFSTAFFAFFFLSKDTTWISSNCSAINM
jgi:hypothetical protein